MKFAAYVAWILLYECCKFGEKICNNSRDVEFFLGDYYFLARPVHRQLKTSRDHSRDHSRDSTCSTQFPTHNCSTETDNPFPTDFEIQRINTYWILSWPKELVLMFSAPKVCAKFHQNQIKLWPWECERSDLIICPMLCYSNGTHNNIPRSD